MDDVSNLIGSASRWQYDVAFEGDYLGKQGILKSNFGVKIRTQKDRFYQLKLTNHPKLYWKNRTKRLSLITCSFVCFSIVRVDLQTGMSSAI